MILAYHEFGAEPDAYAYSMHVAGFQSHVALLGSNQWPGCEVSFDDGHATQFDVAAPILEANNLRGIFFVTVGWMGKKPGFLSQDQLRELTARGHSVQCHGWSHKFLTACSEEELDQELHGARKTLEDWLGVPVDALSAPGGRWDERVVRACQKAGYRRFYLSNPWMNCRRRGELSLIGRYMVRNTLEEAGLRRLLTLSPARRRWEASRYEFKEGVRRALGDDLYQKLWERISNR
ncbi:MAG: polysaccharide deacetylase family protein [Acidobacteriota bacterium]